VDFKQNIKFVPAFVNTEADLLISETNTIRGAIQQVLEQEFNITHVTLQMDFSGCERENEMPG